MELRRLIVSYILPDWPVIPYRQEKNIKYPHMDIDHRLSEKDPLPPYPDVLAFVLQPFWTNQDDGYTKWTAKQILRYNYQPLRQDLERCFPNILRVNRQIYEESVPLMYKGKAFKLALDDKAIRVCSDSFTTLDNESLENRLESLERIFVNVYFPKQTWYEDENEEFLFPCPAVVEKQRRVEAMFSTFATALVAVGTSLKRLHIEFDIWDDRFMDPYEEAELPQ